MSLQHITENLALCMTITDIEASEQIKNNLTELAWLQADLLELADKTTRSIDKIRHVLETKKPN